ncbi:MAG: TadE/TadG family type IV pilus assembly protein [Pseudomonadota bacterium]
MLRFLAEKLRYSGFKRDERGNVMILTAFMTPLLLMGVGTAVDMGEMYRARVNFQAAVDAGTLAFAREYSAAKSTNGNPLTNEQRKAIAEPLGKSVFQANIANLAPSTGNIEFDIGDGDCNASGATGVASLRHQVFFDFIHNVTGYLKQKEGQGGAKERDKNFVTLDATANVKCNNTRFEVALVLDNSGSMRWNGKIGTLRSAAANLVNSMFANVQDRIDEDPMAFSLVPFSAFVNVGSQYGPNDQDASWLDKDGLASYHHEHFNWALDPNATQVGSKWQDQNGNTLSRFSLFNNLPGISWGGCVEARPYPYSTQDVTPTTATPDTLIVPAFAPDTPDDWSGQYDKELTTQQGLATCNRWQGRHYRRNGRRYRRTFRACTRWTDGVTSQRHPQDLSYRPERNDRIQYRNGRYIGPDTSGGQVWTDADVISEETFQNNYLADDHNFPDSLGHPRSKSFTGTANDDQYARQKWTWKYFADSNGNNPDPRDVNNNSNNLPSPLGYTGGPNHGCNSQPITDLTTNQSDIISGISSMQANGLTNIQQGVIWGWKTLSPEEPLTNGRSYSETKNRKVMIVMSDGNNTYYPIDGFYYGYSKKNKSYYGAWGHSVNERIFDGFTAIANPSHSFTTFSQSMDSHLKETCANAKAAGITIYTIAFDVPNGSAVQLMLQDCASSDVGGAKLYYPASNNAALVQAFDDILQSLSELRIAG